MLKEAFARAALQNLSCYLLDGVSWNTPDPDPLEVRIQKHEDAVSAMLHGCPGCTQQLYEDLDLQVSFLENYYFELGVRTAGVFLFEMLRSGGFSANSAPNR